MGRAHRTPRQQGTGFEGREPTQMTGTGGARRSGGPAGVSTTDQEHVRATPETPGVRVHTLTAEEKRRVGRRHQCQDGGAGAAMGKVGTHRHASPVLGADLLRGATATVAFFWLVPTARATVPATGVPLS